MVCLRTRAILVKRAGAVLLTLTVLTGFGCAPSASDGALEIRAVLEGLSSAWNARDASRWVARFTATSGFTNILGMHFEDRDANEARHATLFETIFSDSHLEAEVLSVRMVGESAAVAEVGFRLTGYERLPPGVTETTPGELQTRLITVMERIGDQWHIVAAQNTAVLPIARAAQD